MAKQAPLVDKHRYTVVIYNQEKPDLNDFRLLEGQDHFMRHLEKQIKASKG